VHAGAYAVFEIFNEHSDWAQCNGIYFFSSSHELLWHAVVDSIMYPEETDLCCRPMELWLMTSESVFYFGPHGHVESYDPVARMDPALWHAAMGRGEEAVHHLKKLRLGINTRSMMNNMTALHYAAMEGEVFFIQASKASSLCMSLYSIESLQTNAVRHLLKSNASPHIVDTFGFTPLFYASRFEHSTTVMVLCKAMRCRCSNFSSVAAD
jgi:Ankyrin repeats (3 copies)